MRKKMFAKKFSEKKIFFLKNFPMYVAEVTYREKKKFFGKRVFLAKK